MAFLKLPTFLMNFLKPTAPDVGEIRISGNTVEFDGGGGVQTLMPATGDELKIASGTYAGDGNPNRVINTSLTGVTVEKVVIAATAGAGAIPHMEWYSGVPHHTVGATAVINGGTSFDPASLPASFQVGPDNVEYNDVGVNYKWFVWYR